MLGAWLEMFRSLGQALFEVWKAELAELGTELGKSGKHLGKAIAAFVVVAFVLFWAVMALYIFIVALFTKLLGPVWATGLGLLIFVLVMAALGLWGYLQLKKFDNPAETVRRRVDEHKEWWNERMLPPEKRVGTTAQRPELESRTREELV